MVEGGQAQESISQQQREMIRSLFASLPASFEERYAALQALRDCFHVELGAALEAPLNKYIAQQPQHSYSERSALATHVNEMIRSVGLGLRCPKTGGAGILVADLKDAAHPGVSRFRISLRDEAGKWVRGFTTLGPLPALSLVPDDSRKQLWQRRRDRRDQEIERG